MAPPAQTSVVNNTARVRIDEFDLHRPKVLIHCFQKQHGHVPYSTMAIYWTTCRLICGVPFGMSVVCSSTSACDMFSTQQLLRGLPLSNPAPVARRVANTAISVWHLVWPESPRLVVAGNSYTTRPDPQLYGAVFPLTMPAPQGKL